MKKLLTSPVKMALSEAENAVYQTILKHVPELSLNLMAVKVSNRPEEFLGWCKELHRLCREDLNIDFLEPAQFPILKKLEVALELGASINQFKMARIAPWVIFYDFIQQQSTLHALEERLQLLEYIKGLDNQPLALMSENDRLAFAGKHTSKHSHTVYNFDVEWFAATKGATVFHLLLAQQPEAFDHALSFIPLEGDVTPAQYQEFVCAYSKIFNEYKVKKSSGEKAPLAPATRLLAMRRPDQFIALSASKIDVLCQSFSIVKFNNYDFTSYWQDMIGTLRTFAWWHQAKPDNEAELQIWQARAVLVDLFLFADQDLALQSNFIIARDKRLNKPSTAHTLGRGKVKLTVDELVDKALSEENIPEHVKAKRSTIINEVKKGKTPEQVIGLMRAIFG